MPAFVGPILLLVHLVAAMAWIGGMFFAYFCLRPAAVETLDPPSRLPLWAATFRRFLPYTAVAVLAILASGFALLAPVGFRLAPLGWLVMMVLGIVMALVFCYVYLVLYPRLRTHSSAGAWPQAAQALNAMRRLVAANLVLGLCVLVAAVSAR
jgi:uncharacterized membrane protein